MTKRVIVGLALVVSLVLLVSFRIAASTYNFDTKDLSGAFRIGSVIPISQVVPSNAQVPAGSTLYTTEYRDEVDMQFRTFDFKAVNTTNTTVPPYTWSESNVAGNDLQHLNSHTTKDSNGANWAAGTYSVSVWVGTDTTHAVQTTITVQ